MFRDMFRVASRLIALLVLASTLCVWVLLGAHQGWTKTSVAVEKTDEITGIVYPEIQKRFVPGVDFVAAGTAAAFVIAVIGLVQLRKKHTT